MFKKVMTKHEPWQEVSEFCTFSLYYIILYYYDKKNEKRIVTQLLQNDQLMGNNGHKLIEAK